MPNRSKEKGSRCERAVVRLLQEAGIAARKVPLSGSCVGYKADIDWPILGRDTKWECKVRASGFVQLYQWLSDNTGLIIKADNKKHLVVIPLETFVTIAKAAELARSEAWRGALNRDIPWADWPAEDEEAGAA